MIALLLSLLLLCTPFGAGAAPTGDIPAGLGDGVLLTSSETDEVPRLYHHASLLRGRMGELIPIEGDFFIEQLSLLPYPDGAGASEEFMIRLYNTLRSVSTQEGITYISHRRGDREVELISEAYVVERSGSRKALADPLVTELPSVDSLIVYSRDTSFGRNYYSHDYRTDGEEILLEMVNLTGLKAFWIFVVLPPRRLTMVVDLLPAEEGIILYTAAFAPDQPAEVNLLGFTVNLTTSFGNRLDALKKWLVERL